MSTWTPSEQSLRGKLLLQPPYVCMLFATACVERHGLDALPEDGLRSVARQVLGQQWVGLGEQVNELGSAGLGDAYQRVETSLQEIASEDEGATPFRRPREWMGQTIAFDALLCLMHAIQARIDDPADNATWAARQLFESLFVAFCSTRGRSPLNELALEFERSWVYVSETNALIDLLNGCSTLPPVELRRAAERSHAGFARNLVAAAER